jgi:phosphodiesterase/alkaline phosphatase D-like protein
VTLNGRVNPNGADTIYWFEYSQDSLLGTLIGSGTQQTIIAGTTSKNVSANITGLQANTKYYYHLASSNSNGAVYGSVLFFTTKR